MGDNFLIFEFFNATNCSKDGKQGGSSQVLDVQALRYQNSGKKKASQWFAIKCYVMSRTPCRRPWHQENLYPHGFNRQLLLHRQYLTRTRVVWLGVQTNINKVTSLTCSRYFLLVFFYPIQHLQLWLVAMLWSIRHLVLIV